MTQTNDIERVVAALSALSGVRRVTRGWPCQRSADTLPCIAVQKTGESGAGWRDDSEYLTKLEYTVRVFAALPEQADALSADAAQAMQALGYSRQFAWEETDGRVHQRLIRFVRYV